jgi:MurNAc alpha-1-phosphate uridylyltransferase
MSAAMILAAGRGQRMRPLTDVTPKPLLQVHGKALMQWPMEGLARGGFHGLVVNTAWLGEQISDYFGHNPSSNGHESLSDLSSLDLRYSHEGRDFGRALETAGGIVRALPLLDEVFWVLAGDVYAPDFAYHPGRRGPLLPPAANWPTSGWCPTRRTIPGATSGSRPTVGP